MSLLSSFRGIPRRSSASQRGRARQPLTLEVLEARVVPDAATFRQETGADAAEAAYGVTGQGVTMVIMDRGIDWTNPDFIKPDGTTRIKWLLDMEGQNWDDPHNPPPREYSEADINVALAGGPPINSRDALGHGTVTAGIAAGNGRAYANGRYEGMAPNADLVIVRLTSEYVRAHDDQPEQQPFQGYIDQALDWVDQKITALGQPAVALINSGTQWGPIDGTSAVSRKIEQVFGPDRPGRAMVIPSGDEGALPDHAGIAYDNTGDAVVHFNKTTTDYVTLPIWYTGSQPAEVTVTFDDGTTVGPVGAGQFLNQDGIYIIQYNPGGEFYPWRSNSGDRAVWIGISGHSGPGSVHLHGTVAGAGYADLYAQDGLTNVLGFTDHLVPGRVTDYASTPSVIVAGAYVLQTTYTDIDHNFQDLGTSDGATGDRWTGSGSGPSRDDRSPVVDVLAPGHNAFGTYGRTSWWATFRGNLVEDGGGWYGRHGATSGASPIVTGAVALMLEMDPTLTATQIKSLLHQSATTDDFTGQTPNDQWGYGKLNVLAALDLIAGGGGGGHSPSGGHSTTRHPQAEGAQTVTSPADSAGAGLMSAGELQVLAPSAGSSWFRDGVRGVQVNRAVPALVNDRLPAGSGEVGVVVVNNAVRVRHGHLGHTRSDRGLWDGLDPDPSDWS